MTANETLLQIKYARIIKGFSEKAHISMEKALELFYESKTYQLIRSKTGDIHCTSDLYLIDELLIEYNLLNEEL